MSRALAADRHRNSTKARRICFEHHRQFDEAGRAFMICCCGRGLRPSCGQRIDPVRDPWRADHGIKPWSEGGEDTPENLFPVLERCDREKSAPEDASRIAKNKRIHDRHYGIKRSSGSFAGSRNSRWKKKVSGEVVER